MLTQLLITGKDKEYVEDYVCFLTELNKLVLNQQFKMNS